MKKYAFLFILATVMIDAIGMAIVSPIIPDLMERVGAQGAGQGAIWGGVLMAAYAGSMFLFSPIIGSISDAYGRRPVLIFALFVLAIDYVIMALATQYWVLLAGRIIAGIAGATYVTATAYIADISAPEQRPKRFGMIGAAFGIGFVLGPALGGIAAGVSPVAPFWIAALLAGLNVCFGLFVLPESLVAEKRRRLSLNDLNPFSTIIYALRLPGLALPLFCIFVFEFANMVYPAIWAFFLREMFQASALLIGLTLTGYGILLAFVQGVLMGPSISRFGEFRTLQIAMITALIGMIGFGFVSTIPGLILLMILAAFSDLAPGILTALSSNVVDEDRQGLLQGVIASLASIAAFLGPLASILIFNHFVDETGTYLPGAPFIFSAILVIALLPFIWRLRQNAQS